VRHAYRASRRSRAPRGLRPSGAGRSRPAPRAAPARLLLFAGRVPFRRAASSARVALFCALALRAGAEDASAAGAPPGASGPLRSWRLVSSGARDADPAALALEPGSGRLFVGDARGVSAPGEAGALELVLPRGPVRDLAFAQAAAGGPSVLLTATERGLYRGSGAELVGPLAPGPGAGARQVERIAALPGAVALATQDGVYLSRDLVRFERLDAELPAGPATAVALRAASGPGPGGLELWSVIGGELWQSELRGSGGAGFAVAARRVWLPVAGSRGDPVDIGLGLPGADVAVLLPGALALRRAPGEGFELLRPALPPGASARRLAAALGRLWLATDRGLLEAPGLAGPWRRATAPAGASPVRAILGDAARLYVASEAGLLVGSGAEAEAVRAAGPGAAAPGAGPPRAGLPVGEPGIERVHRAAVHHLGLGADALDLLRRGVRRRGWLPVLALGGAFGRDTAHQRGLDQTFSSGALHDLRDDARDRSQGLEVDLTLSWDLGDLAYHPEQIDVSREAREVIELRDDVLDELTQLYFERRRVLSELATQEDAEGPAALRLRLRADELAAGIDGWTGGWFSSQVAPLAP